MNEKASLISIRLKELRNNLGLTQKEFAELINVSTVSISSYETGTKTPSLDMMINISQKCGVSIDWLCGLSENKSAENVFMTYRDIINVLFNIDKYTDIILETDEATERTSISFEDFTLNDFLGEWSDATNVLYNTSINRNITKAMYDSWVKSKLEELGTKKLRKKRRK